jgi:hypothetical protein
MSPEMMDTFRCSEGDASVKLAGPQVVLLTMNGRLDDIIAVEIADALAGHLRRATAPVDTFWDLEHLVHYHSAVRVKCTEALTSNRTHVASVQTYSASTLVRMGVSVANLVLGGLIRSHSTRAEFDVAMRAAIAAGERQATRRR